VPELREMTIDYCCKNLQTEAFGLIKGKLETLFSQSSKQEIPKFRDQGIGVRDEAMSHYTSICVAEGYNSKA